MNRGEVGFERIVTDVVEIYVFVSHRSLSVFDAPSSVNKQAVLFRFIKMDTGGEVNTRYLPDS